MGRVENSSSPDQLETFIMESLYQQARVKDARIGWVEWRELNIATDPKLLDAGALIIQENFLSSLPPNLQPQILMSIPTSGAHIGEAVSRVSGIPHAVSEKTADTEEAGDAAFFDKNTDELVIPHAPSYKGKSFAHRFRGIDPAKHQVVGLVEAFIARGRMLEKYLEALSALGIKTVAMSMVAMELPDLQPPVLSNQK